MNLIYFSATWCQPCRAIEPKVAQAVEDKGLDVTYVNIEEVDRDVLDEWQVQGVPTMVVLNDGDVIARESGAAILRCL